MNIHDYIRNHNLTLVLKWPADDSVQVVASLTEPDGDEFDIYSNPDKTHFVSINTTRKQYRIAQNEIVYFQSAWTPSEIPTLLQPLIVEA